MRAASKALWTSGRDSVTRATTSPGPDRIDPQRGARRSAHARIPGQRLAISCEVRGATETRSPTSGMPASARLRDECADASAQAAMTVQPASAATRGPGGDHRPLDPQPACRGEHGRPAQPASLAVDEDRARRDEPAVELAQQPALAVAGGASGDRSPDRGHLGGGRIALDDDVHPGRRVAGLDDPDRQAGHGRRRGWPPGRRDRPRGERAAPRRSGTSAGSSTISPWTPCRAKNATASPTRSGASANPSARLNIVDGKSGAAPSRISPSSTTRMSSPVACAAAHSARTAARWIAPNRASGCGDAVGRGLHGTHPTAPSPAGDGRSARLPDVRDDDLYSLPEGLPVPIDDGGCDHLPGLAMPPVALPATDGSTVRLDEPVPGWTIVFAYPRTGEPDADPPGGLAAWDAIPGARGCTPQACAYRDHHAELVAAGARVFGLSTQDTAYQREMAERLHLPFPVLSDEGLALTRALDLPDVRARRPDPAQAADARHPGRHDRACLLPGLPVRSRRGTGPGLASRLIGGPVGSELAP